MSAIQRLDAVCELTMGQAPIGESYNAEKLGLPLIAGAGDFGDFHPEVKKFTTSPGKVCKAGDIVLGIRATIGVKVTADREYCLGRGVAGLRAKSGLDDRYLWHWLTHMAPSLAAKAKGATFKQVNREDIGELPISLPSQPKQKRIAEVLDRADALRAKRRAALTQLDSLTQSIFLDMFGDPRLNSHDWKLYPLKELGRVKTGGTPPSAKSGMFDGPIPFVTPGDLESESAVKRTLTEDGAAEVVTVREGSTFVCCIGATIGKMGKAAARSAFNQQINAVEWSRLVNDDFGLATLSFFKSQIAKRGSSTTLPILKKSLFEQIEIPVPPIELQQTFAHRVSKLACLKMRHREAICQLDTLFASLQSRAFRGEL